MRGSTSEIHSKVAYEAFYETDAISRLNLSPNSHVPPDLFAVATVVISFCATLAKQPRVLT